MKLALGHSCDLSHHDRRVKLEDNRQPSITSVSTDGSSPVSLVEVKPRGNKSKRHNSLHRTGLSSPNSARRLFRTMFDKNSKKSVGESAASRRDCYVRSELSSSTTDQAGSISTVETSSRSDLQLKDSRNTLREFTTGRDMPVCQQASNPDRQPSKSHIPNKRSCLQDSQGEDTALADSINFLLSGSSPKFTNISDVAALADSINFLLGGSTRKFSVANDSLCASGKIDSCLRMHVGGHKAANEIKLNSSLYHLTRKPFPPNPLNVEQPFFVDRLPARKLSQEIAGGWSNSSQPGVCLVENSTKLGTDVDISVIAVPVTPPSPLPTGQNDYEPATPCFTPKSPVRTKKVTPSQSEAPAAANFIADSKIDDLRNMTQDAMREIVQRKSPLFALPEKRSIPAFICIRKGGGKIPGHSMDAQTRASEQFRRAQELLLRLETNNFGEGLSALQKQVEELENEVLFSNAQWPAEALKRCDSDMSSLGIDQVSYNGEDSYLDNDESPW